MAKKTAKKKSKAKLAKKRVYKHSHPENSTEATLTNGLPGDLRDAWIKIRASANSIGSQRIYASGWAIMFARKVCYAFVRPKKSFLELVIFLPQEIPSPLVNSVKAVSKTKFAHTVKVIHADQVEEPITDWLRQAYEFAPSE